MSAVVAKMPLALRVRQMILSNPTLTNKELHNLWSKNMKNEKIKENIIRSGRSFLKKKFFGDLPLNNGQISKAALVRRILDNYPTWSDTDIIEYMDKAGIEATRSCVSNARCVAKRGIVEVEAVVERNPEGRGYRSQMVRDYLAKNPKASPKDIVKALEENGVKVSSGLVSVIKYSKRKRKGKSPDKNQNAGPRARKVEVSSEGTSSYDEIERELDDLIRRATELGNSDLANSIRNSRRMASAAILSQN